MKSRESSHMQSEILYSNMISPSYLKKKETKLAGETARQVRALAALPEVQIRFLTPTSWLATICNLGSRGPVLSSGLHEHQGKHSYINLMFFKSD